MADDDQSDKQLFDRIRQGDNEALGPLYDRYHERLLRWAFSLLRNHNDAEDVVQNSFLKLRTYDKEVKNVKALLYRFVKNEALNELRRTHRRRRLIEKMGEQAPPDTVPEPEPKEDMTISKDITECLDELTEGQRQVLLLMYYADSKLTYKEIGMSMEKSVQAIWGLRRDGCAKMASCLRKKGYPEKLYGR